MADTTADHTPTGEPVEDHAARAEGGHADQPADDSTDGTSPESDTKPDAVREACMEPETRRTRRTGRVRERIALWALWGLLGAVLVAVLAAPFVGKAVEERGQVHAALGHAIAYGMTPPADAVASRECHGDGLVACWRVDRPVSQVADEVQWAMGEVLGEQGAGLRPGIVCESEPSRASVNVPGVLPGSLPGSLPERAGADRPQEVWSCLVESRFGGSGVFVFVDSAFVVGRHGEQMLVGSLVSVTAP